MTTLCWAPAAPSADGEAEATSDSDRDRDCDYDCDCDCDSDCDCDCDYDCDCDCDCDSDCDSDLDPDRDLDYTAAMRLKSIVPSSEVLAGRNIGSWTALAFGAGFVNAAAFLACQRFVTHVTGILTHAGVDEGRWTLFAEYLAVLFCFVFGAMTAVLLLDGRRLRGLPSLPWIPLCTVAFLLTGCAVAGYLGLFGEFGTEVESSRDFVMLWVLAFAMGLQNASVANATGSLVRTTHMTGPATDLGVALAFLLLRDTSPDTRYAARRTVILRGSKIVAFILGAVGAAIAVPRLAFLSFLIPAGICLAVAARVFGVRAGSTVLLGRNSLVDE